MSPRGASKGNPWRSKVEQRGVTTFRSWIPGIPGSIPWGDHTGGSPGGIPGGSPRRPGGIPLRGVPQGIPPGDPFKNATHFRR